MLKDADADDVASAIRAAHRGELQLDPAVARRLRVASGAATPDPAELTARELDVLRLVGAGSANKAIAVQLGISERTARTHVSSILPQARPALAHAAGPVGGRRRSRRHHLGAAVGAPVGPAHRPRSPGRDEAGPAPGGDHGARWGAGPRSQLPRG